MSYGKIFPLGVLSASGVAGAIQFSNGSAFASDAANLFWDDTNNRLGIGTNAPASALNFGVNSYITYNNLSSNSFIGEFGINNCLGLQITGNNPIRFLTDSVERMRIFGNGNTAFGSITDLSARLGIKGSGTTSGTTSLLVQNSSSSTLLQVRDDGFITLPGNTGLNFSGANAQIFNNGGSGGTVTFAMGGATYFRVFQPKNADSGITSGEINTITTPIDYGWSSGSASPNLLSLSPSINNTGAYSGGTFRGIYYNPTITSLVGTNHIAIQTVTGNVILGSTSGNVMIGTTTNAGYKLDVNGSTRVKGNSLTLSASGLSSPPANYVGLNFDENPNHHEYWYAINSKKDLYGAIGTGYDRIIFPTMGNDSSTWEFNALGSYSRILISAKNSTTGNHLSLTNSTINFCGPWTIVSIDRTNRKLIFGNMSTDVHHLAVYDLVIKGAQPYEGNAGGSIANGGNVYVVGGTPATSPTGNYGNVILAHDGTAARGNVAIGLTTPTARLQVQGSGSTSATTSLLVQNSAGLTGLSVLDNRDVSIGTRLLLNGTFDFLSVPASQVQLNAYHGLQIFRATGVTSTMFEILDNATTTGGLLLNIKNTPFANMLCVNYLGQMAMGTASPNASAQFQINSTTRGFLPPVMTTAQKLAIGTPAAGLQVYDSTLNQMSYFNGTTWVNF